MQHQDQPVKIESNIDDQGHEYLTYWYCDPPAPDQPYTVVRDEWNADRSVQAIYEVRLLP